MAKIVIQSNPRVNQIFEDLEKLLGFCQDYGYKFDEKDLYNNKSFVYRQYMKFASNKPVKDNWELDTVK